MRVEHDRRDDLVRAGPRLEHARDRAVERRRRRRLRRGRRDHGEHGGQVADPRPRPDPRGGGRADEQLAFDADVEQAGAERERDGERAPMNGVDRPSEAATRSELPNMPRSSAQYAVSGFSPTSRITMLPTARASRIGADRHEHGLQVEVALERRGGDRGHDGEPARDAVWSRRRRFGMCRGRTP